KNFRLPDVASTTPETLGSEFCSWLPTYLRKMGSGAGLKATRRLLIDVASCQQGLPEEIQDCAAVAARRTDYPSAMDQEMGCTSLPPAHARSFAPLNLVAVLYLASGTLHPCHLAYHITQQC